MVNGGTLPQLLNHLGDLVMPRLLEPAKAET